MITQKYINDIAFKIIGCAVEVQKEMGPGLLESVYEDCFIKELQDAGLKVEFQKQVPLYYKGELLKRKLRLDLLVEDLIIIDNKSVSAIIPLDKAKLLTYLKLSNKLKGLIINFNSLNVTKNTVSLVTKKFLELPLE